MLMVVKLLVRRSELASFEEYERAAARAMREYGGAIERTVRIDEGAREIVTEIHLVRFRDAAGFDAYRASTALAGLRHLRDAAVVDTDLLVGEEGPDYEAVP
jgi:antibiotic biosynthesis monooxygenase (ABM) superfamily enzyme